MPRGRAVTEIQLGFFWFFLAMAGLGAAVVLRSRGVASARIRDLLHVGAGVWVFGWPAWGGTVTPVAITWGALVVLAVVPLVAARRAVVSRLVAALTTEDERWTGIVLYVLAFALLTTLALATAMPWAPAAAALLALAWGDGLGGAVGSLLGRRTYQLPWAKSKTWLGSVAVVAGTVAGLYALSAWTGASFEPWWVVAGAGVVAAVAEGAAPRGTDNLLVPAAVLGWLLLMLPG